VLAIDDGAKCNIESVYGLLLVEMVCRSATYVSVSLTASPQLATIRLAR
jgi:hypothetical protein